MAKQIINIGTFANDKTGDPLRTAFDKTNQNFTEVYNTSNGAFNTANGAFNTANIALELSQSLSNSLSNGIFQSIEITDTHEPSGNIVSFTRPANTNLTDIISSGLILARANNIEGIYNAVSENVWNELVSPLGTRWNWSGWDNITNVKVRQYRTFKETLKNKIENNIIGAELVMHDITNDNYYKIKFTEWSEQGGEFAYTRELINTDNKVGIYFPDGSIQYTSPGDFDWPFIDIHDVDYTIRLSDTDRTIYSFDNTIYIPRDSDVNFPLGAAIYLVTGTASVTVERVQHIGETEAQLFVSGQVPSVASIVLPQRSINILFKAAPNTWYLAPWSPSNSNNLKTWVNPNTSNTWIIVERSNGVAVMTSTAEVEDINTVSATTVVNSSQVRVPRDDGEASNRIQEYWDGIEGGYDYTRIVIANTEYEGFVTTYNSTEWILQIDDGSVSVNTGDPVIVRYYGNPAPVKWFDASDYANANNFLSAKVDYYAYVEGRGQQTGTIWFTASHDNEYDFETTSQNESSGNNTDLEMAIRPSSQNAFTSLWLTTNSSNSESVSIMWDAKMFYGSGAKINTEII